MIYTVFSVMVLVLEICLVGYYLYTAVRNNKFISKGTVFYFIPLSLLLFILYMLGAKYAAEQNGVSMTLIDYAKILKGAIAATVFDVEEKYTAQLMAASFPFRTAFGVALALSIVCVYISIVSVTINYIVNKFRIASVLRNDCDVLIGENEYTAMYAKSRKQVIVVTDEYKSQQRDFYFEQHIAFISKPFDENMLVKSFARAASKGVQLNFICFNEGESNLHYLKQFEKFALYKILRGKNKGKSLIELRNITFKMELDYANQNSIQSSILNSGTFKSYVNCFNRYELLGMSFVEQHPITASIPVDFIDDGTATVKPDKNVNVIFLGFGKTASSLYKAQIMNDCLATTKNGRVEQLVVNYGAFDKNHHADQSKDNSFIAHRFDANIEKYRNEEKYFKCPVGLGNPLFANIDIETSEFMSECVKMLSVKNYVKTKLATGKEPENMQKYGSDEVFNRIIITYGNDTDNIDLGLKIEALLAELGLNNYEIFIKITNEVPEAISLMDNQHLKIMDQLDSVFNHETLVNDRLLSLARMIHNKYADIHKRLVDTDWYGLSYIRQESNIYSALNVRLKLNLLGYDYEKVDGVADNAAALADIREKTRFVAEKYDDYLFWINGKLERANALAYQEHLRWNAFYLANGYVPHEIDKIKYNADTDTFIKDDDNMKTHACLTTYEGLNGYHEELAKLVSSNGKTKEENLMKYSTYKYDYSLVEDFEKIFAKTDLKLIKRA